MRFSKVKRNRGLGPRNPLRNVQDFDPRGGGTNSQQEVTKHRDRKWTPTSSKAFIITLQNKYQQPSVTDGTLKKQPAQLPSQLGWRRHCQPYPLGFLPTAGSPTTLKAEDNLHVSLPEGYRSAPDSTKLIALCEKASSWVQGMAQRYGSVHIFPHSWQCQLSVRQLLVMVGNASMPLL